MTGRGDLAVGGAAIGEAGGGFQALGFPLDGATLAVAPCLAQVVAPFGLADVAVSEHAATGQQRQCSREMGESDICYQFHRYIYISVFVTLAFIYLDL